MTAINNRLNAVADFGDVVPACVVSLCGEAAAEIARLQAQVDALAVALKAVQNRTRDGGSYLMGRDVDVIAATALAAVGR